MKSLATFCTAIFRKGPAEFLGLTVVLWFALILLDPLINSMSTNYFSMGGYIWFGAMLVALIAVPGRAVAQTVRPTEARLRLGLSLGVGVLACLVVKEPNGLNWLAGALTGLVTWGILDSVISDEKKYVE